MPDQNRILIDVEAQDRQDLEAWLAEVRLVSMFIFMYSVLLKNAPELRQSSFEWLLEAFFDVGHEHTVSFCPASTSQVRADGEALHQSASWIVSNFNRHLSSSTGESNSGSAIPDQVTPGGPSFS